MNTAKTDKKLSYVAVAFLATAAHLLMMQVILRRLNVEFPIDLTAFALLLCIQFLSGAGALTFLLPFKKFLGNRGFLPWAAGAKAATITLLLIPDTHVVLKSVIYFVAATAESAALFFQASRQDAAPGLFRLNAVVYAVSGVSLIVAEKFLFQVLSLPWISFVALSTQLCAFLLCVFCKPRPGAEAEPASPQARSDFAAGWAFFSGFLLFFGLVIAHRILKLYLRDSADIVAEISGIGLLAGSLSSYVFARRKNAPLLFRAFMVVFPAVLFVLISQNMHRLTVLPREVVVLLVSGSLAWVTAWFYNLSFATNRNRHGLAMILLFNIVGCFCGAFCAGFYLVAEFNLLFAANVHAVLLISVTAAYVWSIATAGFTRWAIAGLLLITGASLGTRSRWFDVQADALVARLAPGEKTIGRVETPQSLWLLTSHEIEGKNIFSRLLHNSHSMSGTMFPSRRYMKLMAYIGQLYAEQPGKALNIGYGTGLTAQALLESKDLKALDIIDVTRAIIPLAGQIYAIEGSADPIKDARTRFHTGGARDFFRRTGELYDIITGEPPPPSNSSIAYLYTAEFYGEVLKHLTPGGVFTYWLPIHAVSPESAELIWQTFCSAFSQCELYAGTETNLIMVGRAKPLAGEQLIGRRSRLNWSRVERETCLASLEDIAGLKLRGSKGQLSKIRANKLLTDAYAYVAEGYYQNWPEHAALYPENISPLVYGPDVSSDFYSGLIAFENLARSSPMRAAPLRLALGIDPVTREILRGVNSGSAGMVQIIDDISESVSRRHYAQAEEFLRKALVEPKAEKEKIFAYLVAIRRIRGDGSADIKGEALRFYRSTRNISARFTHYVDNKILLPGFPNKVTGDLR